MDNMTSGADLTAVIRADTSQYNRALNKSVSKLENVGRNFEQIGKKMTTRLTIPLTALGGILVKTASETEEMQSKFNQVFGDLQGGARDFADELGESVNRSSYQLQDFLSQLQDTFVPLGFAREEAKELSKNMTELAIDVASFNNKADDRVIRDFQSALVGNTETVRKYGVIINQSAIEQEALRMGISRSYNELTEQERVLARHNIIMNNTSDAIGDAERTSESFANQVKGLKADLHELGVELGEELLPLATDFVSFLRELTESFSELDDEQKRTILRIGALVAAIGPVLLIVGKLAKAVKGLITAFVALKAVINPIGAVLAGVVAVMGRIVQKSNEYSDELKENAENLADTKRILDEGFRDDKQIEEYTDKVRKLREEEARLQKQTEKLQIDGIKVYTTWEHFPIIDIDAQENAYKELGMTKDEYNNKIDDLKDTYRDWIVEMRGSFGDYDNYAQVVSKVQNEINRKNRERQEEILLERRLNFVKQQGQKYRDEITSKRQEIEQLRETNEEIDRNIEALEVLRQQEELNKDQKRDLRIIAENLNQTIGANVVEIDRQGNSFEINKSKIDEYRDSIDDLRRSMQSSMQIDDELTIQPLEEYLENLERRRELLEHQIPMATTKREEDQIREKINSLRDEEDKFREEIKVQNKKNRQLREDMEEKEREEALERTEKLETPKTPSRPTIDKDREREMRLREQINEELRLVDFRYNTEEITQEELLRKLKDNLDSYKDYYEKNLMEELHLRERINYIEMEMEEEKRRKREESITEANNRIKKELRERDNEIEQEHRRRIEEIEERKDKEINAIREIVEERRSALDEQRAEERIAEIDQVIGAYQTSITEEGQERFRELMREREDLELELKENAIEEKEDQIEKEKEIEKEKVDEVFKQKRNELEKERELIRDNYENIMNELNMITEEEQKELEKNVEKFKSILMGGVNEALLEPRKITETQEQQKTMISPSIDADNIEKQYEKIKEEQKKKMKEIDLRPPEEALKGDVYNITNNINITNHIDMKKEQKEMNYKELISRELTEQIKQNLKGVL